MLLKRLLFKNGVSFSSIAVMAGSVRLFQTVKKCYQMLGINSSQSNQTFAHRSRKFLFVLLIKLTILSQFGCFLLETESIQEYGYTFFDVSTGLCILSIFAITVSRISHISKCIEMCEQFIEKSKWRFISFVYVHCMYCDN